jgi:hypothetical protein
MQRLALLFVLVGRVHDGSRELAHGVAGGELHVWSAMTPPLSTVPAHPHVWRARVLGRDLLRPQRRRGEGAHGGAEARRRAHGGAQWPADSEPRSHCVSKG